MQQRLPEAGEEWGDDEIQKPRLQLISDWGITLSLLSRAKYERHRMSHVARHRHSASATDDDVGMVR